MSLQVLQTITAMREARESIRHRGTVGLVPTMGALHQGHRSLMRAAKQQCDVVAASIFVNPTQFGPHEDFAQYPRTFEADCAALEEEGVDLLFAPTTEEMYPSNAWSYVDVGDIGSRLDGRSRPGHFRGVATIVAKLFHIVTPDVAFFGQKDAAQVAVLQTMVRDLNFPLRLEVCPTVREPDGLAMSSRNRYLSIEERSQALALSKTLNAVAEVAERGACRSHELHRMLTGKLQASPGIRLDYAEIVDPISLLPVDHVCKGALIAVAAWVGATRLIDNLVLPPRTALENEGDVR